MGFFDFLTGGKDDLTDPIKRPEFQTDPAYAETQNFLKDFGIGILEGNIPDYYKSIGETGGPEFENVLNKTKADITKSTAASLAKSGRARGGQLAATTSKAIADTSIDARYKDYLRSLAGKQSLLNTGVSVTEGVRGSGQRESGRRQDFDWKDYSAQVSERDFQIAQQEKEDQQLGDFIGTIASVGMGAATGGLSLGWQGALAGVTDALTGGGTSFFSSLGKATKKKKD